MFRHQRNARALFALSDVVLATAAFEIAYLARAIQHWHFLFYLTFEQKALVLGFSLFAWVTIGWWLKVYDKLDSAPPGAILRDSVRQCAYGGLCLLVFQYALRMDLSRFFLVLYSALVWVLLLVFRLTAGRVVSIVRREFAAPHYCMLVGTGERAIRLARVVEESAKYGVQLRGFFSESGGGPSEITLGAVHKVYPIAELPSFLRQHVVDEIIFAVGSESLA